MPPSKHASSKGAETGPNVLRSYYLYAALLALKLIVLGPLASIVGNPQEAPQRASNFSDLKNLTPFWLVAALYVTSGPDPATAVSLLRTFVIARMVTAVSYVYKIPNCAIELAFFVTFGITLFMAASVVYTYRSAM